MPLLDKIEELQNKPENYRRKVLVVLMVTIMSVVVAVWVSTVNLSVGGMGKSEKKSGVEYAPLNTLKEGVINIKESFNEAVSQFKNDGEDNIGSESGGDSEEETIIIEVKENQEPPIGDKL